MSAEYYDRIFAGVDAVPAKEWAEICQSADSEGDAAGPFMDLRFLRVVETTASARSRFWPVVIYDEHDRPAACAWLTLFHVDGAMVAGQWGKRWTERIRRLFPNYLYLRMLLCGSTVSSGQSGLRIRADADTGKIARAVDRLLGRIAAEQGARIVAVKEFDAASCRRLAAFDGLGYLRADSLPNNLFEPRFATFDEVQAAMKGRYRGHCDRSRRKFAEAGLRLETTTDAERIARLYTPAVHGLYRAVEERAKQRFETLPEAFFQALTGEFPGQVSLTLAWRGEAIVGFVWGLLHRGVYSSLFVGLDYALNAEADLYFNLIMHDLDFGLRQRPSTILIGQSADQFKSRLGCHQESRYFFVKARGWLLARCLRWFRRLMFPAAPPPRSQRELFRVGQSLDGKNVLQRATEK